MARVQLWRLKLLTASRISEMIDLRWSAVDVERQSIAIGQRKTGRTKTLTLTPAMRAVLAISAMGNRGGERTVYEKIDFSQAGADLGLLSP